MISQIYSLAVTTTYRKAKGLRQSFSYQNTELQVKLGYLKIPFAKSKFYFHDFPFNVFSVNAGF